MDATVSGLALLKNSAIATGTIPDEFELANRVCRAAAQISGN